MSNLLRKFPKDCLFIPEEIGHMVLKSTRATKCDRCAKPLIGSRPGFKKAVFVRALSKKNVKITRLGAPHPFYTDHYQLAHVCEDCTTVLDTCYTPFGGHIVQSKLFEDGGKVKCDRCNLTHNSAYY